MDLLEEQKIELFEGINNLPDQKMLNAYVVLLNKRKEIENKKPEDFVSKALRNRMVKSFMNSGVNEKEAESEIKNVGIQIKNQELKKVNENIKRLGDG